MLFGQSKIGKKDIVYIVLAIKRYANRNVSVKAGFVNYFSTIFVDLRKVDLSPKLLKKYWLKSLINKKPFDISLARLLLLRFAKSD